MAPSTIQLPFSLLTAFATWRTKGRSVRWDRRGCEVVLPTVCAFATDIAAVRSRGVVACVLAAAVGCENAVGGCALGGEMAGSILESRVGVGALMGIAVMKAKGRISWWLTGHWAGIVGGRVALRVL